jgi:general stress protein YciG
MAGTPTRGLGSENMDEEKKREIQSKGGKASSAKQNMSELGRKGGQHSHGSNT